MHPWLAEWGKEIGLGELSNATALALVAYLNRFASDVVKWTGARRSAERNCELVTFDLLTDAPQRPFVDIRRSEPIGILFSSDDSPPIALSLRDDFPDTEHQLLVPDGVPSALCIDDRPWAEARTTWTPAELVERLSLWFHRAARGELHDPNQPLDPFFGLSDLSFVFPRSVLEGKGAAELAFFATTPDPKVFLSVPLHLIGDASKKGLPRFTTVAYRVPPERMKRLRNAPSTLGSLTRVLHDRGVDIVSDLRTRMKEWYGAKATDAGRLGGPLAIVVEFPIISPRGEMSGAVDTRAFVPQGTLGEIGVALGALFPAASDQGSRSGFAPVLIPGAVDPASLDAVQLDVANVHIEFDQQRAAELAGLRTPDLRKATLIGAGAIGSQVAMILAREGRFAWSIVDDDTLLPHNLARHTLEFGDLGKRKAAALRAQLNELRPPGSVSPAISLEANVLRPGKRADELKAILNSSDIILDTSASIAVERFLSDHETAARRASAFFNPSGESVVVLVEPHDRGLTLRDLEAQYYRVVLREPALEHHLSATGERFAYTGACRALSNRIPQSRAALLSSLAAAALGGWLERADGGIGIWTLGGDSSVSAVTPALGATARVQLLDWTVTVDDRLKSDLMQMRSIKLPRETGGILLGTVDSAAKTIHVVEALQAPPDSKEETTGFERGMVGVEQSIRNAMARTMDQVRYVGEWHSHPPRTPTSPSFVDLTQMLWLAGVLEMEGRPAVMLIAGDKDISIFTGEKLGPS